MASASTGHDRPARRVTRRRATGGRGLRPALLLLALVSLAPGSSRPVRAAAASTTSRTVAPTPLADIEVAGEWRARLERADRHLRDPALHFRADLGWGVDQSARWISTVGRLGQALRNDAATRAADAALDSLLARQRPDGAFDPAAPPLDARVAWGETRALLLLTDRLAEAPRDSALRDAALRLGRRFLFPDLLPTAPDTVVQAGPLAALEGLVALYRLTGAREFLAGAQQDAATCDTTLAPPGAERLVHEGGRLATMYTPARLGAFRRGQHQAHTWLEVAQALPDLGRAEGGTGRLATARALHARLVARSLWVSGGMPEAFGEYFEHNDETCAAVSWLRLNLKLFRETGETRYLDLAELTLLNHLAWDQSAAGGYCTDRSVSAGRRVHPGNKGGVADECCSMSGPDGLLQALGYAVTAGPARVDLNFFVAGRWRLPRVTPGAPLELSVATEWPDSGRVVVKLAPGQGARAFTLRVRRPAWLTDAPTWSVNGRRARPRPDGAGYLVLRRAWQPGDSLVVEMPLALALVGADDNGFNAPPLARFEPGQEGTAPDAALRYGPLVLMVDRMDNPGLKAPAFELALFLDEAGRPFLPRARAYAVAGDPFVRGRAHFTTAAREIGAGIDDAAGGGASLGGDNEAPWRRVTLVPMSELTRHARLVDDACHVRNPFVLLPRERAAQLLPHVDH